MSQNRDEVVEKSNKWTRNRLEFGNWNLLTGARVRVGEKERKKKRIIWKVKVRVMGEVVKRLKTRKKSAFDMIRKKQNKMISLRPGDKNKNMLITWYARNYNREREFQGEFDFELANGSAQEGNGLEVCFFFLLLQPRRGG